MARYKSLVARIVLDRAGRLHQCQHSNRHDIAKGEIRLKVSEGRTDEHFCRSCAVEMLESGIYRLQGVLAELKGEVHFDEKEAS